MITVQKASLVFWCAIASTFSRVVHGRTNCEQLFGSVISAIPRGGEIAVPSVAPSFLPTGGRSDDTHRRKRVVKKKKVHKGESKLPITQDDRYSNGERKAKQKKIKKVKKRKVSQPESSESSPSNVAKQLEAPQSRKQKRKVKKKHIDTSNEPAVAWAKKEFRSRSPSVKGGPVNSVVSEKQNGLQKLPQKKSKKVKKRKKEAGEGKEQPLSHPDQRMPPGTPAQDSSQSKGSESSDDLPINYSERAEREETSLVEKSEAQIAPIGQQVDEDSERPVEHTVEKRDGDSTSGSPTQIDANLNSASRLVDVEVAQSRQNDTNLDDRKLHQTELKSFGTEDSFQDIFPEEKSTDPVAEDHNTPVVAPRLSREPSIDASIEEVSDSSDTTDTEDSSSDSDESETTETEDSSSDTDESETTETEDSSSDADESEISIDMTASSASSDRTESYEESLTAGNETVEADLEQGYSLNESKDAETESNSEVKNFKDNSTLSGLAGESENSSPNFDKRIKSCNTEYTSNRNSSLITDKQSLASTAGGSEGIGVDDVQTNASIADRNFSSLEEGEGHYDATSDDEDKKFKQLDAPSLEDSDYAAGEGSMNRNWKVDLSELRSLQDHEDDINVSIITWNLAEESPSEEDASFIRRFRRRNDVQKSSDFVLISGQECENIKPRRTEGHRSREFRRLMIKMLGKQYVPIALHSLGGIQFGLFCKRSILSEVETISVADVTCGIGNVFHNKGAIAAFVQIKAKQCSEGEAIGPNRDKSVRMMFATAHMAAHVKNTEARDSDFWRIVSELEAQAPPRFLSSNIVESSKERECSGSKLLESMDRIFFCGDLNYRVDLPREISEHTLLQMKRLQEIGDEKSLQKAELLRLELLRHDQLICSMSEKRAFPGFAEGKISFAPTFKFDKGTPEYDSSYKQRIPAWTDRVLFKPIGTRVLEYDSISDAQHSDHRPVYATFRVSRQGRQVPKSKPRTKKRSRRK
jgi:phosphatidylinositol-bisphosphatase